MPQLLVLLDNATGPDGFKSALWKTRHVGTGSMDYYFDHAHMLALPEMAAKQSAKQPTNP